MFSISTRFAPTKGKNKLEFRPGIELLEDRWCPAAI